MYAIFVKFLLCLLALGALCEEHDPVRVNRIRSRAEVRGSRVKRDGDAEGHEDILPTREETQVTLVLRQYDNPKQVVQACLKMGAWPGLSVEQVLRGHPAPGCNAFDLDTKTCTVHTLRPRYVEDSDRMENLGHETLHCFEGAYHTQDKF
jgi:hypothetical protein